MLGKLASWQAVEGKDGWRDLSFIAAFLHYPDFQIRARARESLLAVLPAELEKMKSASLEAWLRQQGSDLSWDAANDKYLRSKK